MTEHADLRRRLARAADSPVEALRDARGVRARDRALGVALTWLPWVPAVALGLAVLAWLGLPLPLPSWWLLAVLTAVPPVLYVLWRRSAARVRPLGTMDGLALLDRALRLDDRLQTAYELSSAPSPSPFVAAAVDDAVPHVARAETAEVAPPLARMPLPPRALRGALVAAVLLVAAMWLGGQVATARRGDAAETARAPDEGAAEGRTPEQPDEESTEAPERPQRRPARLRSVETAVAESEPHALPDEARMSRGTGGAGESSAASDAQGSSQARGMPSGQAEASAPPERRVRPRKPKPRPDEDETAPPPPREDREGDSGATAGTGASAGSNRNPATSEWASKDHVAETEDDPLEDDEDVEDDESEQENRGGAQPMLRDRRPAVNRDLTIGFGNRPSEDANGRGGPSQMKKSRGVASLILGVPIPDHVKGQQNPGRTKVTQERVEPREDDVPPVAAESRTPRSGPAGAVVHPRLGRSLRDVVRTYFLTLRRQEISRP